ncbi:TrkH family potassium uptake protein [Salinarchaeum sp. IM2453]|uniref:TrkH family potassium uptake protein n=1 Tax=Salinarchaeum sp. IM2453 TaxID=2862870 RepID=UPI001C82EB9B|nr:TrkH family potassium uptake protein [Salinarchaeum sp. IM2453]QZA89186.1 TrkH family potassium uptake protein [Salinarchaeum sp. IM2453]
MNIRVNWRRSLGLTGTVLKILAIPLLFPTLVALYYGESPVPFLVAIAITVLAGYGLEYIDSGKKLRSREAFLMVSMSWLFVAMVSAIPFVAAGNGTIAHPINALFESMSGLTTTGATVLRDFDHPQSILMWRQLVQWLGGLGILVLAVAILSKVSVGGAQLMETESQTRRHTKQLTPHIKDTARLVGSIYAGLTGLAIVVLYTLYLFDLAPNMTLFNAVAHAFTSVATAGFSPEAGSLRTFEPIVQYAIMPFMIVGSTSFVLLAFLLRGQFSRIRQSEELRFYLTTLVLFSGFVIVTLFASGNPTGSGFEETFRQATFNVVSIITTTGYANADFAIWTPYATLFLFLGMFLGGMAGSTTCSIKSIRWLMVFKSLRRDIFTAIHPDAVRPVRVNKGVVDEDTIRDIYAYVLLVLIGFVLTTILIIADTSYQGVDAAFYAGTFTEFDAMGAAASTFLNIGPAFGPAGPFGTYDVFPMTTKAAMIFVMWVGRIEIIPVLVLFSLSYWTS